MNKTAKIFGRFIVLMDKVLRELGKNKTKRINTSLKYESTGIHVVSGEKPKLVPNQRNIVLVDYDNPSHKLWRGQEFTLIDRNKKMLARPILDLGCGDGSFGAVLFENIEYGVDPDDTALAIAKTMNLYAQIINSLAEETNLPDGSVGSVFSNSVLEHTVELEAIIAEVSRILRPDGVFMFTVPNHNFTNIIGDLFGHKEAKRLNDTVFFHRNLLTNDQWINILNDKGLQIVRLQNYQPEKLNYVFRLLRSPFLRRINNVIKYWDDKDFLNLISYSLECNKGAGTFIIAKKNKF